MKLTHASLARFKFAKQNSGDHQWKLVGKSRTYTVDPT
jgi:hypothetical protein